MRVLIFSTNFTWKISHSKKEWARYDQKYIGCHTTYQTRQFFYNSKTNEDIATRFEQEYVRCVRNEKECVCSKIMSVCVCSKIIKELLGLVGSGTPFILVLM